MKIVPLDLALEPVFWRHVNQDRPHYFFFALDWSRSKEETDILLALTGRRIEGMMLVFRKKVVQLRGTREAARLLLKQLNLEEVELQAQVEHQQHILERYEPTWSHELMLMVLHRGEERPCSAHPIIELSVTDAPQIAALMTEADPEFWGTATSDTIIDGMSGTNWTGIELNGVLASVCRTRLLGGIGHITTVATHEAHRNKGYATSLVSHSVESILRKASTAIIYVLSDNQAAIKVYTRVGFRPYKTYFFIKGRRCVH